MNGNGRTLKFIPNSCIFSKLNNLCLLSGSSGAWCLIAKTVVWILVLPLVGIFICLGEWLDQMWGTWPERGKVLSEITKLLLTVGKSISILPIPLHVLKKSNIYTIHDMKDVFLMQFLRQWVNFCPFLLKWEVCPFLLQTPSSSGLHWV